jgi:hypothetical protein
MVEGREVQKRPPLSTMYQKQKGIAINRKNLPGTYVVENKPVNLFVGIGSGKNAGEI